MRGVGCQVELLWAALSLYGFCRLCFSFVCHSFLGESAMFIAHRVERDTEHGLQHLKGPGGSMTLLAGRAS